MEIDKLLMDFNQILRGFITSKPYCCGIHLKILHAV